MPAPSSFSSADQLPYVVIETTMGKFCVELYWNHAPRTCRNFSELARRGYYNGTIFHRIIADFMIQGGDPTGTGRGGASIYGDRFQDEFDERLKHTGAGILSMANAGPNTNGSQFFITLAPTAHLDGKHTIFGRIAAGMKVIQNIGKVDVDNTDRPKYEVKILKAYPSQDSRLSMSITSPCKRLYALTSLKQLQYDKLDLNGKRQLLTAYKELVKVIHEDEEQIKEFYSLRFFLCLGKLVSVCLEAAGVSAESANAKTDIDSECRNLALENLLSICSKAMSQSGIHIMSQFLPGIVSQLTDLLTKLAIGKLEAVEKALKIIKCTIVLCLCDASFEKKYENSENSPISEELRPEITALLVKRDDEWRQATETNLRKYLLLLSRRLSTHSDSCVRFELLSLFSQLFSACRLSTFFQPDNTNCIIPSVLDLCLHTITDEYEKVSSLAQELFSNLSSSFPVPVNSHLHEKLRLLVQRLPLIVKQGNGDMAICQLSTILRCLAPELRLLLDSRSVDILCLFRAFAQSLQVDRRRVTITKIEESEGKIADFLTQFPLKHSLQFTNLRNFCHEIGKLGFSEVLDLIYSEIQSSSNSSIQSTYLYQLILTVDSNGEEEPRCESTIFLLELLLEKLKSIEVELQVKDEEVKDTVLSHDDSSVLLSLSIIAVALLSAKCRQYLAGNIKLQIDTLFYILKHCVSENWLVAAAAQNALTELAKEDSHIASGDSRSSVSRLLSTHSPYVISKVALVCRRREDHTDAPLVFRAFMERASFECLTEATRTQCQQIVDYLLQSLDSFQQKQTLRIVQCLSTYINAVNRSTSNRGIPAEEGRASTSRESRELTEEEKEQAESEEGLMMETEKPPAPQIILNIEGILKRTKHLLFSSHRPIQINALVVLNEGLICLQNFDDALLPMVHQNWLSIASYFNTSNDYLLLASLVQTINTMSTVSKTFIYRRVLTEWWPPTAARLRRMVDAPSRHHSDSYKFQAHVFRSIPTIVSNIGVDSAEDIARFSQISQLVVEKSPNSQIRDMAAECTRKLDDFRNTFT